MTRDQYLDEDLQRMSRQQLIEEVKALRQAFVDIVMPVATNSAGIIRSSGDYFPRRATPFPWCRSGRNSCAAA